MFGWDVELTAKEAEIYKNAVANKIPLENVKELKGVLKRAYKEIEQEEIDNALCYDDFVMECQGKIEVDPDEINKLVQKRDPYTLAFFELTDATDEELDEWDANDLDELPWVRDFEKDFEPQSPYDCGWSLIVEFVDPNYEY